MKYFDSLVHVNVDACILDLTWSGVTTISPTSLCAVSLVSQAAASKRTRSNASDPENASGNDGEI